MPDTSTKQSAEPETGAACSAQGCTCSPTTGTCARCCRTHRVAYGIVFAVAAVTAATWLVVTFWTPA